MEDENQRRTWEYLQTLTRKDGSYGKVLSEAFVFALDMEEAERMNERARLNQVEYAEIVDALEERLQRVQEALKEQIKECFQNYVITSAAGTGEAREIMNGTDEEQMQEPEMTEDMMAFAFGISKEVNAEIKKTKSMAVPVNNIFGGEEYVKIKKSDWNTIVDAFSRSVSRNHLLEKYEKKISRLENKINSLSEQIEKLKRFIASQGLGEAFVEFVKSLAPKTLKQRLEEKKADVEKQSEQRKLEQHKLQDKKKYLQQEI